MPQKRISGPHGQPGVCGWHSERIQRPTLMQTHGHRDLLRDIVTRVSAPGSINSVQQLAKVAQQIGVQGNKRADRAVKDATAPRVVTDYSQSLQTAGGECTVAANV